MDPVWSRQASADPIAAAGADDALARMIPCVVGGEGAVAPIFESVRQRCGRLDVPPNNAGMGPFVPTPERVIAADWRLTVETNSNRATDSPPIS